MALWLFALIRLGRGIFAKPEVLSVTDQHPFAYLDLFTAEVPLLPVDALRTFGPFLI